MRDFVSFLAGLIVLVGASVHFGSQTTKPTVERFANGKPHRIYTLDAEGQMNGDYWEFRDDGTPALYVDFYHGQIGWGCIRYDENGKELERRW